MNKNNNIIITALVAIIVGGLGFFGGMKYQQSKQPAIGQFFMRNGGAGGNGANRMNGAFRPIDGSIIASDDKSITVKLQDGSSKIILIGDNTQINKADKASKTDLKTGETVAVFGQTNTDGSVTAQNIQLNPILRNNLNPNPTQSNNQ